VIVKEEEEILREPMFLTKDIAGLNEYFEVEIVIFINNIIIILNINISPSLII
jgi:hypothetical protein